MGRLIGYFARGLVLLAPIFITIYVMWLVLGTVDGWLGIPIPGAGLLVTVGIITVVGFLGSNLITRSAISALDSVLERLPFVRLLYGSTRDLLNAFVGEKRRFDQPVSITLDSEGSVRLFGFVTQESLTGLGLTGFVSVYCPHSYNFSGQMIVVPADRVTRLEALSADVMAFIVSGGVAGMPALGAHSGDASETPSMSVTAVHPAHGPGSADR